tara:strand:- start:716 stop:1297 length:582 start_codon:yes stop_codon:yes gene_type:complete
VRLSVSPNLLYVSLTLFFSVVEVVFLGVLVLVGIWVVLAAGVVLVVFKHAIVPMLAVLKLAAESFKKDLRDVFFELKIFHFGLLLCILSLHALISFKEVIMAQKLTDIQIKEGIAEFKDWSIEGNSIRKSFLLDDHIMAMGFVNRIAMVAEVMNHHPEIQMVYNKVEITLSTHDVGGVTELDLELAQKIEAYF